MNNTNPIPQALSPEQASFALPIVDHSETAHPIALTQPSLLPTFHAWLKQPPRHPFLLVAPPTAGYQSFLTNEIPHTNQETISYLIFTYPAFPLAPTPMQAPTLLRLPQNQAERLLTDVRLFTQSLQTLILNIPQQSSILQQEENYTKDLLRLEQQLLTPIKSLAKNFQLYIVEEENLRFKAFPKFQVMHQENLYSLEEIDHLYYQKELTTSEWQSIQQQYSAILHRWQEAIKVIRQQELTWEERFHQHIRQYSINQINQHFHTFTDTLQQTDLLNFLTRVQEALVHTLHFTPSPNHLTLFEAMPHPIQVQCIHSRNQASLWVAYDDIHNLWGSYDIKESGLQLEPGLLLRHPQSVVFIQLPDLLRQNDTWLSFKEMLHSQSLSLVAEQATFPTILTPLTSRIVLIAPPLLYETILYQDADLQRLFPIFILWQSEVLHTPTILGTYQHWLTQQLSSYAPQAIIDSAITEPLIRHFIHISENRKTISTEFDLLQPIQHYLTLFNPPLTPESIQQAILWDRQQKAHLWRQMLQEIEFESVHIPTQGMAVGKVVALVVIDIAQESYGLPTLLSATAAAGKDGLINIEREAGLSGEIHDKGAFIADAYIRQQLGRYTSLSVSASLAFEQTYDGVEGDSATAAEVATILSAIGNIPLKQSIGITGSMNQHGELQAIGGISQKIEGFFTLCQQRGLTGEQGVILPAQNIQHLLLSSEIIQAITEKRFHLWPCTHIHQAIALLSDLNVSPPDAKHRYPKGSFFHLVEEELKRFSS